MRIPLRKWRTSMAASGRRRPNPWACNARRTAWSREIRRIAARLSQWQEEQDKQLSEARKSWEEKEAKRFADAEARWQAAVTEQLAKQKARQEQDTEQRLAPCKA